MRRSLLFIIIAIIFSIFRGENLFSQNQMIKVSVVTPYWDPEFRTTGHIMQLLERAGENHSDLVCLPQDCVPTSGEPIPGPISRMLGEIAKKYSMYVVGNIKERDGNKLYQTSFLLGRWGELLGKYRQTHKLPDETIDLGDELPVFTTDFGKIALTMGSEHYVRELYQVLGIKGAGLIVWSSSPELMADEDFMERILRRRIDGYKVWARYAARQPNTGGIIGWPQGKSMIIDGMGNTLAQTGSEAGITTALIPMPLHPSWSKGFKNELGLFRMIAEPTPSLPEKKYAKRKARITLLPTCSVEEIEAAGMARSDIAVSSEYAWPPTNATRERVKNIGRLAKKYHMYVAVSGFIGRAERNEMILFDREGQRVGLFYKIHTTTDDAAKHQIPGTEVPVFDTDFGRLAWRICADEGSPDIDRCFALQRGDMIFHPTMSWTGRWREDREAAMAADNGIYFARVFGVQRNITDSRFYVVDRSGRVIRRSQFGESNVMTIDIDFDTVIPRYILSSTLRYPHQWKYPDQWTPAEHPGIDADLRETIFTMRRPELYRTLADPDIPMYGEENFLKVMMEKLDLFAK